MLQLLALPLRDSAAIALLRRHSLEAEGAEDRLAALGLALARAGCTHEAAHILRPLRRRWAALDCAAAAREAIEQQAWWSKHWKPFVALKRSRENDAALALLGERARRLWDLPALLVHLSDIATDVGHLDLAAHLLERVRYLAQRGLPGMNMDAFAYVAEAALIDVLARQGELAAAIARHRGLAPSPGNAMAHAIQLARLLVAAGRHDDAMQAVASIVAIGRRHRTGYSRHLQEDFVASAPELAPLRARADWPAMLADPDACLMDPARRRVFGSAAAGRGPPGARTERRRAAGRR